MEDSLDLSIRDLTDELSDDLGALEVKINNLTKRLDKAISTISKKYSFTEEQINDYAEKLLPDSDSIQNFIFEFIFTYFQKEEGENLLKYLSHKYIFPVFVSAVFKRIIHNPEFKYAPYANIFSKLKTSSNQDLFRFTINNQHIKERTFDISIDYKIKEKYYNIEKYAEAVSKTRKVLGLKGVRGKSATVAWSKYYDAAHGIRKITKVIRGKKGKNSRVEDVTEVYKNKYWTTINIRASMLNSLSFYDILDTGAIPRPLKSNVGGEPHPAYSTSEIFFDIYNKLGDLRRSLFEKVTKSIITLFIDIELPSLNPQTAKNIIESLINGEELSEREELILIGNIISESPIKLEEALIRYLLEKYGINTKRFNIIHTKNDTLSIRMRNEKGQFIRWKDV